MSVPQASLVVPVRDEAGNIGPLVAEIAAALGAAGIDWELFVVDDGSTDGSWPEIAAAAAADPRVRGIRLDRGRGKSAALAAGFAACRAPRIVMLDGDGQDDPAEIPRMLGMLTAVDLVNGWKTPRLDPWHKTLPSRVFNLLVGWLTGLRLHDHNCGLKAFRSEVARAVRLTDDMHRFIPVLAAAQGFRVTETPVHHRPRTRGASKYGVGRFFSGMVDIVRVAGMVGEARGTSPGPQRGESRARLRRSGYALLATLSLAAVLGRIGAVASVDKIGLETRMVAEQVARERAAGTTADEEVVRERVRRQKRFVRPFLSANDRSRWLAVRALVERGTFAIDELVVEPGWDTIDAVAHPDATGRLRLYSSKPPLLSVIAAGPYWILHGATGWTLGDHPFELGRMLMVLYGLLPLGLTILFTCRLVESAGTTDWGRLWSAALIACGTLLTTFAVVFTNHLPAAACTAASGWLLQRIRCDGLRTWTAFAAAGFWGALAAALELPALAWLLALVAVLAAADPRRTFTATLPAALVVGAAFFGSNWLAHGVLAPPYAHRGHGPAVALAASTGPTDAARADHWNPDNWYDYAITLPDGRVRTSYWRQPQGVDRGEASALRYAWHVIGGHHGILSLTPAWLLAIPGLALLASRRRRHARDGQATLAGAVAFVSLVVLAFYLTRPQIDRNYGGMTCGFRWALWMAPLWVFAAVPTADLLASSRIGRGLGLLLLGLSVVSVAYPTWNPWTMPWIQEWMIHAGLCGPP
ncbi:MAG: glycosyltransferase [Planctomycetia bacterium]|nr:glycosyltransferase [Planctomycetia bacterium]